MHSLRYEHLLQAPHDELTRLAGFIGVEARGDWLAGCVPLVDRSRPGRAAALADEDVVSLRAACEPGALALKSWHG